MKHLFAVGLMLCAEVAADGKCPRVRDNAPRRIVIVDNVAGKTVPPVTVPVPVPPAKVVPSAAPKAAVPTTSSACENGRCEAPARFTPIRGLFGRVRN